MRLSQQKTKEQKIKNQKVRAFTLLEMLLVLAISSSLVVLLLNYTTQRSDQLRRDKTVLQMQQILNAALSYYVSTSVWPVKVVSPVCGSASSLSLVTDKLTPNYLPQLVTNAYGAANFYLNCNSQPGAFYVYTQVDTPTNAGIIAGQLPMAFNTDATGIATFPPTRTAACSTATPTGCNYVVSFVNVPGQNLNNARSVNFAGTYSPSACVPAPNCPAGMKASITVVPVGVSGVNDSPTCSSNNAPYNPEGVCSANVYPVSSFTAFAVGGDATGAPAAPGTPGAGGSGPYDCQTTTPLTYKMPCLGSQTSNSFSAANGASSGAALPTTSLYWRVCLKVITAKGQVVVTNSSAYMAQWGKMTGSIAAFTRCVPNSGAESPSGSGFDVWQSNNNNNP